MRQIGYQQQFQVQQQRAPHFMPPAINSQRIATLPNEMPSPQNMINSPQLTRRSMYAGQIPVSHSQPPRLVQQPIMQQPQQNQRFNSPLPKMTSNSAINSPLSYSNLSIVNNQTNSVGLTTPVHQPGTIQQQQQSAQSPSAASLNSSISSQLQQPQFSKSLQETFSSHAAGQGIFDSNLRPQQVVQKDQKLIQDLEITVIKLKEELGVSRALCASTQRHNDELIQKIKVLIKENEKIQQKEQQEAEKVIQLNEAGNPPNIQLLMLENKRFLGVIRDLESKTKLLMLENEKQLFLLKQAQIFQQKNQNKTQISNMTNSNQNGVKDNLPQGDQSKEDYNSLQKKSEIQSIELKNYLGISQSLEKKIDLLLGENEKLQKIVKEKQSQNESLSKENGSLQIKLKELRVENQKLQAIIETTVLPEHQVVEIESNSEAILVENKRINELLSEKNAEVERLQQQIGQLQSGNSQQFAGNNIIHQTNITNIEQIGKLTAQNQNYKEQLESLSKEAQNLQNEKLELNSLCEFKHKELEIMKQKVNYLEQEVMSLKSDDLKERYVTLQGYISETKMRVHQFENAWKLEKDEILRCHKIELNEMNKTISDMVIRLDENQQKLVKFQAEIKDSQGKLQAKQSEINVLKIKVDTISQQMERCRMEMDEIQKQYFEKQMELSKKQAEVDGIKNQLILAQNERNSISNESARAASLTKNIQEKFDQAYQNLKESRNELQKVQTQNQQLQQEMSNLILNQKKQVSSLEDKIQQIEQQQYQKILQQQQLSRIPVQNNSELTETLKRLVALEKEMQSKILFN